MLTKDEKQFNRQERWLFLKRCLKHPLRLGAAAPSSPALARLIAKNVLVRPDKKIVELGAGTGSLTRSLLAHGVPEDQLIVLEIDPELCAFLRKSLPNVHVIQGNAVDLPNLLSPNMVGAVSTIVSGIPMVCVPEQIQYQIIKNAFQVLEPGGDFLQWTYVPKSPIPAKKFGLSQKSVGRIFFNIPPAILWQYRKKSVLVA